MRHDPLADRFKAFLIATFNESLEHDLTMETESELRALSAQLIKAGYSQGNLSQIALAAMDEWMRERPMHEVARATRAYLALADHRMS